MIALDLFAGTGWGVACQRLGIEEYGVEIMPEAVATRTANGMKTIYKDVWTGLDGYPQFTGLAARADLLIASPPCQTFSMAGGGKGREALDEVIGLIDSKAYLDVAKLRAFGEAHDPRTALVLTPLAHVARDVPTYVVFEQVPPVLPVWERCAEEMRRWGYSVWTGVLNAEQYGVPQTRRRAILIARADGKDAKPPTPTHSRYYSRDPKRLDEGVFPWVSMAEALGWSDDGSLEYAGAGATAIFTAGQQRRQMSEPAHTMTGAQTAMRVPPLSMRSNYGTGGDPANRGEREGDEAAPTMTSKADRNRWVDTRPATTVAGDSRVWPPGHKVNADRARRDDADEHYGNRAGTHAERVTVAEAAALQSYPEGFTWCGTKTKQFLQIGNAVPPLLAEAILREVIS